MRWLALLAVIVTADAQALVYAGGPGHMVRAPRHSGPACGDGTVTEACDDGNTAPGDGCSALCAVEAGWECSGSPSACAPLPLLWTAGNACGTTLTSTVGAAPTFTRASTGTYWCGGALQSAASGAPRVEDGGVLIEETRRQRALYSDDLATGWTRTGMTIASAAGGWFTATATGSTTHYQNQTTTSSTQGWATYSIDIAPGTSNDVYLRLITYDVFFNAATCAVTSSVPGGVTAKAWAQPDGSCRVSIAVSSTTTNREIRFGPANGTANSFDAATNPRAIRARRPQLELGPVATSYYAAGATSTLRETDSFTETSPITGNDWCIRLTATPSRGRDWHPIGGLTPVLWHVGAAAGANRVYLTNTTVPTLVVTDGAGADRQFAATAPLSTAQHVVRACNASGTLSLHVDGSPVAGAMSGAGTGLLGAFPSTLTIGATAGGGNEWGGVIRDVKVCADSNPAHCP